MYRQLKAVPAVILGTLLVTVDLMAQENPPACGQTSDCFSESRPTTRVTASYGRFYFKNNCKSQIKLALKWRAPEGERVAGWWRIDPKTEIYLTTDGKSIQVLNDTFYYYAISNDDDIWRGDVQVRLNNQLLPMRQRKAKRNPSGNRSFSIRCSN